MDDDVISIWTWAAHNLSSNQMTQLSFSISNILTTIRDFFCIKEKLLTLILIIKYLLFYKNKNTIYSQYHQEKLKIEFIQKPFMVFL